MTERVLVLAAHPDDETFGMGATIAKHCDTGDIVSIVIFADGLASRGGVNTANIQKRHGMCRAACKILGTEDVWLHQYADNMMDNVPLLIVTQHIEKHLERFKPTIVYTHHDGDLNVDHRVMCEATRVACRPQPGSTVKRLLHFEIPCSTRWGSGFEPDYFMAVTQDQRWRKSQAMEQYAEELREPPHPRSMEAIENLMSLRGSSIGLNDAEAFVVGRIVA